MRYGRFYFRPISGNGFQFGISPYPGGVLAFSRVLNGMEVLVVANTNVTTAFSGQVIVDVNLSPAETQLAVLFCKKTGCIKPEPVKTVAPAEIHEIDGSLSNGPACVVRVTLAPMEIQIFGEDTALGA